jgi:hypothetical protein
MDRGGQAPRPASDIKHGKMAVVGLAGVFWPISNTPIEIDSQPAAAADSTSYLARA